MLLMRGVEHPDEVRTVLGAQVEDARNPFGHLEEVDWLLDLKAVKATVFLSSDYTEAL